ncbi:hypothetical protein BV20DRAFT_960059 [Pilatotrama ljubarskyi]|nr:hypothetical protein BV20DRAFT_960059 [Pilatotrama ljubarskyi]
MPLSSSCSSCRHGSRCDSDSLIIELNCGPCFRAETFDGTRRCAMVRAGAYCICYGACWLLAACLLGTSCGTWHVGVSSIKTALLVTGSPGSRAAWSLRSHWCSLIASLDSG